MPILCFKSTLFPLANHPRDLLGKRNLVRQQNFSLLYIHILTRAKYTYISQLIFFPFGKELYFQEIFDCTKVAYYASRINEFARKFNYQEICEGFKVTSAEKFEVAPKYCC